jgi:anthranilate synthase/aminodeoxychorismate synthase-like glutamine amidotransferase
VSVRLLLIDNYDSFTYNLVQAFLVLGADVTVYRNDAITVAEAEALEATHLVISPGPGRPRDAGVSMDMIRHFAGRVPVLGVCLGHQSIVEVFGGEVVSAAELMHGKTSLVHHDGEGLFRGLPNPCEVGRYHSLAAQRDRVPESLVVTARTEDGEVMGVRHRELDVAGVQFHPESVLTPDGPQLLGNFLYPGR